MMDESSKDISPSNRVIIDEPIAEKTAMSEPAKEKDSADGPLRVSAYRRWSHARPSNSGYSTAEDLKARLNPYYPLQASFRALVDYVADLKAKNDLRSRLSEVSVLTLKWVFQLLLACTMSPILSLINSSPAALVASLGIIFYCAIIYVYNIKPLQLEDTSEMSQLRNLESLMVETLGHRELEILCRYGDYLAERLNTLRQYVGEHRLEDKHKLSEKWTETSATLRAEEGQTITPCHDLIRTAAQGLNWKQDVTVFMAHEYGKRNSLMHAELFDLVDTKDWNSIGQRCQRDIEKLRELFINSNSDSKAAIENWELIIGEFRDRWVRPLGDGSTWEAHLIVKEAIAAGVDDSASLSRLSMRHRNAIFPDRDKAIKAIKKEKEHSEKQQKISKKLADAALQTENKLLQAEVERLRTLLEQKGASRDFLEDLGAEVGKNDVLKKENKTCNNRIKDLGGKIKKLEDDRATGLTRQRTLEALEKLLKELGFEATEKTTTDAEGKQTTSRKKDTDTQEKPPTI
ncbi:MAG: hypothetical protein Q9171_007568 [Xanthocarpia ochracea]